VTTAKLVLALLIVPFCLAAAWQESRQAPLIDAVKRSDVAAARRLLDGGADPNSREVLVSKPSLADRREGGKPYPGDTALMIAVEMGNADLATLLLDRGADVNGTGEAAFTPLIAAARGGRVALAKLLLDRGAKPNQRNDHGDTAIVFAANAGQAGLVELLLGHGADINGGTGWTPLMDAAYNGWEGVARLLIRKGANVNFRRDGFMTPLECAQVQGHTGIARLIRKAGGKGRSPEALRRESEQAARELKQQKAGAQPEGRDTELSAEDRQVVETALLDLLAYKDRDLILDNEAGSDIILLDKTARGPGLLMDDQINSELDDKRANDVTLKIRESLTQRNGVPVSLAAFKPASKHILLRGEELARSSFDFRKKAPKARAWVQVYLPGYSMQHDRAVLRFQLGPSPHGAAGTCFLAKQDGAWRVKWRSFAFFV
jgi:ankyrin repeat protein